MFNSEYLGQLAKNPPENENERRELYTAARSLYMSLERPVDAFSRVSLSCVLLPMTQIAVDLGLFRALSQATTPLSANDLSTNINAQTTLLERVLRYLACFGLINAEPVNLYAANATTRYLSTEGQEGGIKHHFRNHAPIMQVLPDVLREQGYCNPTDCLHGAFQVAHKTTSHAYSWTPTDPSVLVAFHNFLKSQTGSQRDWTTTLSPEGMKLSIKDIETGRVLFCDVGGGSGSQSLNFRKKFQDLKGKVVLQDQESVISKIDKIELQANDIEIQGYNFFEEQPIKGAKTYFLRYIMHDWPDAKCLEILARLKAAMGKDSQILLDEIVISDTGASWKQVQVDIQMMAALASMERSESQWRTLLKEAGLKLKSISTYGDDESGKSIIRAVLP